MTRILRGARSPHIGPRTPGPTAMGGAMHSSRWIQVVAALSLAFSLTAQASRADDFRLLEIGSFHVKWGAAVLGQGAEAVTYGFVRSPSSFPGARNCPTVIPADGIAGAAEVDRRRLEALAA